MIEVEIKVGISDPDGMRKLFEQSNGKYVISLLHEDTYFNMPEGLRDFRQTDEALRLRKSIEYERNKPNSEKPATYFITYKGKKIDTETKTREEIEIKVEQGQDFVRILKALGFREVFTVKKERELYEFHHEDQTIEALIDYLPILKRHFMEVELMAERSEELEQKRELLFSFLSKFGIQKQESIRKSYLELIADKFKKRKS